MSESLQGILYYIIAIIIATAVIVAIFYIMKFFAYRTLKLIPETAKNYHRQLTATKLFINTAKYILAVVYMITVALIFGIDVNTIITSIGFVSVALGFGAKSLVEDCIAGLFIFFEKQYDVGDTIEVNGFKGEVTALGFKSTTLRNWTGDIYITGNGKIESVINYSQADSVAVIKLRVDVNTDLSYLETVINKNIVSACKDYHIFIEEPEYKGVTDIDSTGVEIMVTALTKPMGNIEGEKLLRKEVLNIFNNNSILLSYPKLQIKGESHV